MRLAPRALTIAALWLPAIALSQEHSASLSPKLSGLSSDDPAARARAACELKDEGSGPAGAIAPLVRLLADGSPVARSVCREHWWRNSEHLTTPGEQAAAALVSIGSQAFEPLLKALQQPHWIARRNAAWALGALEDRRAVGGLLKALDDPEPDVRAQAAWALGVIDDAAAFEPLTEALKDRDVRVRRQAAWALGVLGDPRAAAALIVALKDADAGVRRQAAWALGVIGQ